MAVLTVRIEEETKEKASAALADIGMDLSTGVKVFLTQVIAEQGLPFTPTRNPATLKAKWDREVEHTLKYGHAYANGADALRGL